MHTGHLIQQRRSEMAVQQRGRPWHAVHEPSQRLAFVFGGSFFRETWSGSQGLPIEALLAPIGFANLAATTWRGVRQTRQLPPEGLLLLTMLVYFLGISAGLLLAWSKYILASFLLGTLLSGVGLVALLDRLRQPFAFPFRTAPRPDPTG
jgi:hypothetical protein